MPNSVHRIGQAAPTHGTSASPEVLTVQTVALNIASHREELLRVNPGAVELAAECVFAFHGSINGSLTTVLASRAGSYAREQGTGKRSLTVEDLCEMVTRGGSEGRRAVLDLLSPILDRIEGGPDSGIVLGEAVADFAQESGDVAEALMRGKTGSQILRELNESDARSKVLRKVLRARDEATRTLSGVLDVAFSGGRQ